jgi:protein transport protein SEC13
MMPCWTTTESVWRHVLPTRQSKYSQSMASHRDFQIPYGGRLFLCGDTDHSHDGPVWQVAWAHPKFGTILASASYDSRVIIWRDSSTTQTPNWSKLFEHTAHTASVNSISWAPHELGAILACASSDGKVSILEFKDDGTWDTKTFNAHGMGCNAVSWAPAIVPGSLVSTQPGNQGHVKKIATGGCDNLVKIWALEYLP